MADEMTPEGEDSPPSPPGGWTTPANPPDPGRWAEPASSPSGPASPAGGGGWSPAGPDRPFPPPPPAAPSPAAPPPPPGGGGWGAPAYQPPNYQPPGYPPPPYQPPGYPPPGYPGGGYTYPGGGYPGAPARQEPLATWSLVLGILSFVFCPIVGAVAAIITGSRAKKAVDSSGGTKSGRGVAVAGQVLGSLNLALSVIVGVLIGVLVAFAASHQTYTALNAGDCFDPVGHGIFSTLVTKKSCDKPHRDESVGSFDLPDSSWPGAAGTQTLADPQCSNMARDYIGPTRTTAGLRLLWFYPSRASWDNGNREVVCAVAATNGSKLTGSVGPGGGSTGSG